ncbi:MAG: hypothetical protein Q3988_02565 [Gemella sp.]|nr:hypothetical protein [Gemella sp.]
MDTHSSAEIKIYSSKEDYLGYDFVIYTAVSYVPGNNKICKLFVKIYDMKLNKVVREIKESKEYYDTQLVKYDVFKTTLEQGLEKEFQNYKELKLLFVTSDELVIKQINNIYGSSYSVLEYVKYIQEARKEFKTIDFLYHPKRAEHIDWTMRDMQKNAKNI